MKEKFFKLGEIAKLLRESERPVFRYIHSGKIKATKIGYWRISRKDVQDFIKKNSNLTQSGK